MIVSVGKKPPQETGIKVKNHSSTLSLAHRRDFKQLLQGITGEVPLRLNDINLKEFAGFQIALLNKVQPEMAQGHASKSFMSQIMFLGQCIAGLTNIWNDTITFKYHFISVYFY